MANKHMPWDLAQMQSLPLEAKIIMTQQRIRIWYEHWDGMVYVGWSGGKDSTVLKHIVDGMYDDVPSLFANTGLEYPEIQRFVKDVKAGKYDCFNSDVVIVRPQMRFDEVLKRYGYPLISKEVSQIIREAKIGIERNDGSYKYRIYRITGTGSYAPKDGKKSRYDVSKYNYLLEAPFDISEQCCKVMKKNPSRQYARQTGRKPILGTMASESALRNQRWMKYGCNAFDAKGDNQSSNPLSFWTEQDILHYIKKYDVPYCPVYGDIVIDEKVDGDSVLEGQVNLIDYLGCYEPEDKLTTTGCKRTGCIFCMFGCHLEKEPNRFQRLKETHPRQYEYCINGGEMVDGKWQPSKDGLGLGKVLDYIGVKY
jgi:3'-phosphoadenosine 5'-phosphosulfate sulfotransferase (PAPS reductase)/FAD synthetase